MITPPPFSALQLATRATVGGIFAYEIARGFALAYPMYALISAVVVTDLSPARTRDLALPRLAGTALGACVGPVAAPLLGTSIWAAAFAILPAMFAAQAFRWQGAAKLAGYVCAIVMLEHGSDPWSFALYRFVETVLGIGVAVLASLVPKLFGDAKEEDRIP